MSLQSFLTQTPIQYGQGMSQSSTQLPQWYTDYTQGILQNAAQFANQGYQAYQGPRVAGLTPDQQKSYQTVQGAQGMGSGIAQQGVNQLNHTLQQPNASQAANPYLQSANQGVHSALSMPNAAQAGNPYVQAASNPIANQIGNFMNPYIGNVVNASNALSARNFNQNILPGLQDQFTRAGQVGGSTQQGLYAQRLGTEENLNEQMTDAQLLAGGFNTALGGAEAQSGIYGGLANTAGNLANSAQGTGLYGAGLTAGIGSTAGGLANASQNTGIQGALGLGSLGTTAQNNALTQAFAQNQMGQQQQQQTQQNYNTAYGDFLNQTNFPLTAAQGMGSALQGIQIPAGQQNYYNAPLGMGNQSPIESAYGLYNMFSNGLGQTPAARGGRIRFAKGGSVRKETLKLKYRSPLVSHG